MKRQKLEIGFSDHSLRSTPQLYELEQYLEECPDFSEWVTATSTKAYLLKDPILDWLKYHSASKLSNTNFCKMEKDDITSFIMRKGVEFESHVVTLLKQMYDTEYVDIKGDHLNVREYEKYVQTKEEIMRGTPFIFSGVLWNYNNKTYGVPDILIRSDYVNDFITMCPLTEKEMFTKASNLKGSYHYVVIDIKFTTMKLCADGEHLLNEGMMPCYKSQLYIYNEALSHIQGYTSPKTYILGRRWNFTSKGIEYAGESCFDKLGVIDYVNNDSNYVKLTKEAIEWIIDVRNNGDKWLPNGTHPKLYPNMSNKYDYPWRDAKKKIADDIDEITSIWMCGVKNREKAHTKDVYRWSDARCNSSILGMNGPIVGKIVDKILDVNKQSYFSIEPQIITNNYKNWKCVAPLELYIDFETINDAFLTNFVLLPRSKSLNIIFQIGVGWVESNTFNYKSFVVNEYTQQGEYEICCAFLNFVRELSDGAPPMFHWSSAEPSMWNRFVSNCDISYVNLNWVDMLKVFKSEPIVIKGVFNYTLKNIAKKMFQQGLIQSIWDTDTQDGASVMLNAVKALEDSKRLGVPLSETDVMKDIIRYNEYDCKTLYEVVKYLRENKI